MKTIEVLHVLYDEREHVQAGMEMRTRRAHSPLNAENFRDLIYNFTKDQDQADEAYAKFILDETRPTGASHG